MEWLPLQLSGWHSRLSNLIGNQFLDYEFWSRLRPNTGNSRNYVANAPKVSPLAKAREGRGLLSGASWPFPRLTIRVRLTLVAVPTRVMRKTAGPRHSISGLHLYEFDAKPDQLAAVKCGVVGRR